MEIAVVDLENNGSIENGFNHFLAPASILVPQFKLAPELRLPGLVEVDQHSQPALQTTVTVGISVHVDVKFSSFMHHVIAGPTEVGVWQKRLDPGYFGQEV